MHLSIIFAAPLLIAAVVMATRFVGCSLDESGTASPNPYSTWIIPTPSLVSLWRLNETATSSPALDSKDGNSGAYQNATGVALGVAGLAYTDTANTAARFDGGGPTFTNGGYVSVKLAASLNPTAAFTVEALVNPSVVGLTTDPADYHAIVSSRHINPSPLQSFGYILYLHGSDFEAWIGDGSANFVTIQVAAGAKADRGPYYVAMTYDGAMLKLYVNPTNTQAELLTTPDQYAQVSATTYKPNTVTELRIGAGNNDTPAPAAGYCFPGEIQDVAVYNAALAFTDIQSHYAVAMTGFST
jgi:hypothetical protein